MFEFDFSDKFRLTFKKIAKKNNAIAEAINRKVKEIINRDADSINAYRNLTKEMSNFKRVHITGWLVMIFEVDIKNNFILFSKIGHRDEIYKKR